jgi:predicted nucleotidyltransferase
MAHDLQYPTLLHQQAAEAACRFFQPQLGVDTVLVVNSLARGQGIPESDLDMNVLVRPGLAEDEFSRLEGAWREELANSEVLRRFRASGAHAHVHLDVVRGEFVPGAWDDGGGPDGFELGIGNLLAYGAPMHGPGPYYCQLQEQWLPYYGSDLRRQRLEMAREACRYDLGHVPFFADRGLHFQAFDRLYKAFQEFLQALFISRRVYPLAYNKWIRMQVVDWLGLPELYPALPRVISVANIESGEVVGKAEMLVGLLERWVPEEENQ